MSKIKRLIDLKKIISSLKKKDKAIVFTNGCFDLIHYGHVKYLSAAKRFGDYLIVGLNSDKSVKKIKGSNRPITPENDRAKVLAALSCIDFVVIFNGENPLQLIKDLKPDVLVKGGDWKKEDIIGARFVESYGGKVKTIPFVKNRSTTSLIQKIIETNAKGHKP